MCTISCILNMIESFPHDVRLSIAQSFLIFGTDIDGTTHKITWNITTISQSIAWTLIGWNILHRSRGCFEPPRTMNEEWPLISRICYTKTGDPSADTSADHQFLLMKHLGHQLAAVCPLPHQEVHLEHPERLRPLCFSKDFVLASCVTEAPILCHQLICCATEASCWCLLLMCWSRAPAAVEPHVSTGTRRQVLAPKLWTHASCWLVDMPLILDSPQSVGSIIPKALILLHTVRGDPVDSTMLE